MIFFISILMNLVIAMLAMAFFTLMERKFLGYFQLRKGPNKVMMMGLPQPFADAIKLFINQQISPMYSNKLMFFIAPMMSLSLSAILWMTYPHLNMSSWIQYSIILFLCVSSLNVYTLFLTGWSSNSKYALLGALRGVAQTISYEISMVLIFLSPLMLINALEMGYINSSTMLPYLLLMFPILLMFMATNMAETNRAPFDFAEGESELVSGFNIEYGSATFAFIFMAEYANILFMSLLTVILMIQLPLKELSLSLVLMTLLISMSFIWVRASFPRLRYDFLMNLTWSMFLPMAIMILMIICLWY
nr:TPA: NADH dehydrogenase subunit 1 [Holtodrilus truncatus]